MSRISELGFYNDKDVITQIEWLKKNIGGNLIESLEVKEITDPESADFGKTDIIIHMENGDTHEASYVSALVKSAETRQEGDDVILTFNLATGDKFETRFTVSVHATAAWDSLEGTPQESVPLTEWMNTKAEKTELTAEETARTNADNALAQRITDLDEDVADEITRIDGEITQEITARTEADALKEDKANKVSAFQSTPDNNHYPTEKLVKEKCFDIDYQLTETNDYKFAEHRMGNGIVLIEGFIKTFSLAGASGRTFDLYFKNDMDMIKIAPISRSASGYADISYAMTETSGENRIKFEMYNSGSGNVDVGPSFIGFGRVQNG